MRAFAVDVGDDFARRALDGYLAFADGKDNVVAVRRDGADRAGRYAYRVVRSVADD